MILKRVHVKNFRSIRDVAVDIGSELAIVGGNGSGKSSILRAIERFFGQSTSVDLDDFFGRKIDEPIEIGLTFCDFTEVERENFSSRIYNDEMTVVRVFDAEGGRNNGRYYGATLQHSAFAQIRNAAGAQPTRTAYNQVRDQGGQYAELPTVARADQVPPALEEWEANHPELCGLARDDGQFFGFTNVARGALNKSTSFVFIPAVRDASADALDSRGAVVSRLMELVVRSAIQRRKDVQDFQLRISTEYKALTDPEKLVELGGLSNDLTETLKLFYGDAAVSLLWKPPEDFTIPLPTADVFLNDDGFEGPVDRKGHGLQRAFIFTLLQHLAKATSAASVEDESANEVVEVVEGIVEEQQGEHLQDAAHETFLPGLILAIEEPELYQHPTKQRHFAKVLSQLSTGELPGVARRTQVLFATHSSLFVSMDRFEEIALARRESLPDSKHKSCKLTHSTLTRVARRLEKAYDKVEGSFTGDGLRARLHIINAEIAEGFFADAVVLVEGASDRAAILAAAELDGIDLGSLGVAVLVADGKSKLDRPATIFTSLEIPTYVIWDCDRKGDDVDGVEHNRALQRLMGVPENEISPSTSKVASNFACFESHMEKILKDEIGSELYQQQVELVKVKFDIKRVEDIEKAPFAMTELLKGAAEKGGKSKTLSQIVRAIADLRGLGSVEQPAGGAKRDG